MTLCNPIKELFELFLASGIYQRYAEKYMNPDLIDAVDIGPYLGVAPCVQA